jgi:hypothetical protein
VLGIELGAVVGASVGPVVFVGKVGVWLVPGPQAAAIESVRAAPIIIRNLFKTRSSLDLAERSAKAAVP